MTKRALKKTASATGTPPARSSDRGKGKGVDFEFDLSNLNAEIELEKLVLDLTTGASENRRALPASRPSRSRTKVPAAEQRAATRLSNSDVGDDVQVGLSRSPRTVLVNVSDVGALVETNCQLSPGRRTSVFLTLRGERHLLRATVVRSSLHSVTQGKAVYRSALHFEETIGLVRRRGRRVPTIEGPRHC